MKYQAVLFDLDGTLLNTIDDLADAMNASLVANGLPGRPDVEEHKHFVGDGVRNYVLRAMPEDKRNDEDIIATVTAGYRATYAQTWQNKTRPYAGVVEMLDELHRQNLRLAVLSNKPNDATRQAVSAFFGLERFEVVRGVLDGAKLKPNPTSALAIAEEMGVSPGGFLYLGDTNTDMQTAVAAGMYPVGATWGFRLADELTANGAKTLINHPTDLLKMI